MKKRHIVLDVILKIIAGPFVRRLFRYKCDKVKLERPAIVLCNHVTNLDPAFVQMAFKNYLVFVASEHTFRWGFASKVIRFVFDPIPRVKGRADARTVKSVLRTIKAGVSVCIFAEGDTCFSGRTGPIVGATGKMVKLSGADLVTYKLEGGYLTSPRWGKGRRPGRMRGHLEKIYSAEELKGMSPAQVSEIIQTDLYEDAYARQAEWQVPYKGKAIAENLETALFLCPGCGKIGSLKSEGEHLFCACGLTARYTELGYLEGANIPYHTPLAWDDWQREELAKRALQAGDEVLLRDEGQTLYEIKALESAAEIGSGELTMSGKELRIADRVFLFEEISDVATLGQMKLTFSTLEGKQYEIQSDHPRSALKYQVMYRTLAKG